MKFGTNFGHIASTVVNENKPRCIFSQKGIIFSLNYTHHPFDTIFEWKCTDTLAKLDNILLKIVREYSLIQYPTTANRMPW